MVRFAPRRQWCNVGGEQLADKKEKGTCTLAIVMLFSFGDESLPGGVEGPFATRDVTSFYEIWEAARGVEKVCLLDSKQAGWATEGIFGIS